MYIMYVYYANRERERSWLDVDRGLCIGSKSDARFFPIKPPPPPTNDANVLYIFAHEITNQYISDSTGTAADLQHI